MDSESHVLIDLRALADLRSRAQQSEAEASKLRAETERLGPELESAEKELELVRPELETATEELRLARSDSKSATTELERVASELASSRADHDWAGAELARLGEDLDDLTKREDDRRINSAELTEALRQAQARYWDTSRELDTRNEEFAACTAALQAEQQQLATLKEQFQRITGSRAWRLISAYRRLVNRLRRRSS